MKFQTRAIVDSNCYWSPQFDGQHSKYRQHFRAKFPYMDQTFRKSPCRPILKRRTIRAYSQISAKLSSKSCKRSCIWYISLVLAICSHVIVNVDFLPLPCICLFIISVSWNVFLPCFAATTSAIVPSHFPKKSCFLSLLDEESYRKDPKTR